MAAGMKKTYCKKGDKLVGRSFTDGSKVRLCSKAWSVFFATIRKHGWKETKPRPRTVNETVFNEAVEVYLDELRAWFAETVAKGDRSEPTWVRLARRVLKSGASEKLKAYWRKRLQDWEKKNKKTNKKGVK
jgi:hypothetical protein